MRNTKKDYLRKGFFFVIAAVLSVLFVVNTPTVSVYAVTNIGNPVIDENQITTWDTIWFGSYYQDADQDGYFVKSPIRWRVLSVNGNDAFLITDQVIDCVPFNEESTESPYCVWEKSTSRSWLNGYGASENQNGIDFTGSSFLKEAFTAEEQNAIIVTTVDNSRQIEFPHTSDDTNRKNTRDKIYLPSLEEVTNPAYGFSSDEEEESPTRTFQNTLYAANGGTSGSQNMNGAGENNSWILRTPGEYSVYCEFITEYGSFDEGLVDANVTYADHHGICPVLHLNLAKTNVWSDAGKVSARKVPELTIGSYRYVKKYGDAAFAIPASTTSDGAFIFSSSDESVVSVDEQGLVTINGGGSATITVATEETGIYASVSKTITIDVRAITPSIEAEAATLYYGNENFVLPVISEAPLSFASDNENVLAFGENGNVIIKGIGSANVTITSLATPSFKSTSTSIVVTVEKGTPVFADEAIAKSYGDAPFKLDGTTADVPVTYESSDEKVVSVAEDGTVSIVGVGTALISMKSDETQYYHAANADIPVTVEKASQKITAKSIKKTYGSKDFKLGATASGNTALTYQSSDAKVVSVAANGQVTIKGTGKSTITILAEETDNYRSASKKITVTVKPGKSSLKKVVSKKKTTALVSWEKDQTVTGYEIQYSTSKNFKSKKTVKVTKNTTKSATLKKLTSGKIYYVRVRGYKTTGDTKLYGAYSTVKKVKVK